MISLEITINHKVGLHARPAALFVTEAQKYKSRVNLVFNGHSANAKSLLGILGLGVLSGAQVTVSAHGEDEIAALAALKSLIENNFSE